jgi:hypothetical protein
MDIISEQELLCHDQAERGEPVDGILLLCHKARQLGATALARSLLMHRLTLDEHVRGMTASIDDEKIDNLALRDQRILKHLPWWLRPSKRYDTKGGHLVFDKLDNMLQYQTYTQTNGIGQGETFEIGHLTECASAANGPAIEHHYFPTIPQSPRALQLLETTAQGRGNWWHETVTKVLNGYARRWKICFIPWYAEESMYRAIPPVNWKPTEASLLVAQKIYDTSLTYLHRRVMLSKPQLYWYETTREEYARGGTLHLFLSNYPSTLEESFQHSTMSAFSPEVLEALRNQTREAIPYDIQRARAE